MTNIKNLNMDFEQRIVIQTNQMDWQSSPSELVFRKALARANQESGHATSLVKYSKGSSFNKHEHPNGEEILVLDGVFSDEKGDYPKGTYIRNPPGTSHSPFSEEGCTLLVKLSQFEKTDKQQIIIDTLKTSWQQGIGGLQVMPLHTHIHENTALVMWPKNEQFHTHNHFGGEEIYVISGQFQDQFGIYPKGTWIRSPHNSQHTVFVEEKTLIWVKTGHIFIE